MPIRFRCVYCNQLLGISRRKAGTVVRCTTCQGQLIVPDPNEVATDPSPSKGEGPANDPQPHTELAGGNIFERNDFDALFEPYQKSPRASAVASAPAPSPKRERSAAEQPLALPHPHPDDSPPALVLTRAKLTVVSVLLVVALGLSFAGGLLVGINLR